VEGFQQQAVCSMIPKQEVKKSIHLNKGFFTVFEKWNIGFDTCGASRGVATLKIFKSIVLSN